MNIFSKKISAAFMMIAMAASVNAQDINLSVDPVTVAPGEEAEVVINYEGSQPYANIQFDFTLPEGLSFVEQEILNADEETELVYGVKGTALYSTHALRHRFQDENNKVLRLLITHGQNKGIKNSGSLFSFKVKADESLAESSEILVSKIEFSGMDAGVVLKVNPADFTVPVTKSTPTAISGIEANYKNAASYNLGGVKFGTKGLRIMKGKKFVQK